MVGSGQWTYDLGPEHALLRDTVREFMTTEVAPVIDEHERERRFPTEIVRRIGELGWLGIPIPEDEGGAGLDTLAYAIAIEEIGRVWGSLGLIVAAHTSLGCGPLHLAGSPEQKQRWLVPMARGEVIGAYGLTEPGAGSDSGGTRTTARFEDGPDGGSWVLDGAKRFITNAGQAGTYIVTARTGQDAEGRPEISAFIVPADTPGFSVGRLEDKLGLHASATGELRFEGARVPAANLLGEQGSGFKTFLKILDGGRISIGALAVGLAQAALDASIPYARTREQFGRPIGTFQGVAFMVADMATEIEAARQLVWRSAWLKDQGRDYGLAAAQAKLFASEVSSPGDERRDPDPRRLRLRDGLSGRAVHARREADRDRRGDEPGPAAGDRQEDPGTAGRLSASLSPTHTVRTRRDRRGVWPADGPDSAQILATYACQAYVTRIWADAGTGRRLPRTSCVGGRNRGAERSGAPEPPAPRVRSGRSGRSGGTGSWRRRRSGA